MKVRLLLVAIFSVSSIWLPGSNQVVHENLQSTYCIRLSCKSGTFDSSLQAFSLQIPSFETVPTRIQAGEQEGPSHLESTAQDYELHAKRK